MKNYDVGFRIGDQWLCVESLAGHDTMAVLSLRKTKIVGGKNKQFKRPGPRLLLDHKKRHDLIALALDLLAVAQKMLPEATFNNSRGVFARGKDQEPQSEAFRFTREQLQETIRTKVQRWHTLHERIHILQLAARVLEDCNEDVATTIASLLFVAERQGALPITAVLQASPVDEPHSKTCN